LDAILTSSGDDLPETLKLFIEASMACILITFTVNHL